MNYYLEYLIDEDRSLGAYSKYSSEIQNLANRICSNSIGELVSILKRLSSDNEPIIITIISHGYFGFDKDKNEISGLALNSYNPYNSFISWQEIIKLANNCRTKYPVILNLLTPCNSFKILDFISKNDRIDRIWYSKKENLTIRHSIILAEEFQNFNQFCSDILSDEELNDFGEFKNL